MALYMAVGTPQGGKHLPPRGNYFLGFSQNTGPLEQVGSGWDVNASRTGVFQELVRSIRTGLAIATESTSFH